MTEFADTLLMQLQTSDIMDTWTQGLISGQTSPKHVIKFTKGPVPEIFNKKKKNVVL
jgi:hypothetical protein